MNISLIIIASEILEAKVLDQNTLSLAKYLKSLNLNLSRTITVSDSEIEIKKALKFLDDSDLIILSGGLGPTQDDITKSTLANYYNQKIIQTPKSIEVATQNFQNKGRTIPTDHAYTFIPEKFWPLLNPYGYAPGLAFEFGQKRVISLPGVPYEFQSMLESHLSNYIFEHKTYIHDFIIRTTGIGEEKIFKELDPLLWNELSSFGKVASLPSSSSVDITVRIEDVDSKILDKKVKDLSRYLKSHALNPYIWNIGPETLEEVIISRAKKANIKFGFAESATGGLCSHKITNVNGSSSVFYGGVICYDTAIKINELGVNPAVIEENDVVSIDVASQMATGLKNKYPVDLAVSITGYAGPHSKEDIIPIGTVCIGVSGENESFAHKFKFNGNRSQLKEAFSRIALFQLLKALEKLAPR